MCTHIHVHMDVCVMWLLAGHGQREVSKMAKGGLRNMKELSAPAPHIPASFTYAVNKRMRETALTQERLTRSVLPSPTKPAAMADVNWSITAPFTLLSQDMAL